MLIGNKYADNKMYRGIKHYDNLPLTSSDIHEYADAEYMKNAYVMNNLLGYGTMNTPNALISANGISLSKPSVVIIDGDISLIQSDEGEPLASLQDIQSAGYAKGVVCILGWYQHLTSSDKLRNYGGVDNSEIDNDLLDPRFSTVVSTRYQFRWYPIIVNEASLSSGSISLTIRDRDKYGDIVNSLSTINSKEKNNQVFIFNAPSSMNYILSDMYLVPLVYYSYSNNSITGANVSDKLSAGSPLIVSQSAPTGRISDGTRWYNPTTREFKTYISESGGFVDTASKMAFLQYQSIYVVDQDRLQETNVEVPIDVSSFQEGDILRVIYEGLELAKDLHYTIDYYHKKVTLLNFTTRVGDTIYFTVTRVVEASDITNVTETFVSHMNTTGSSTVEGHVKLSDTLSNSSASQGVAATPKMVKDAVDSAKILTDDSTGKRYKFGVKDGALYVEEV